MLRFTCYFLFLLSRILRHLTSNDCFDKMVVIQWQLSHRLVNPDNSLKIINRLINLLTLRMTYLARPLALSEKRGKIVGAGHSKNPVKIGAKNVFKSKQKSASWNYFVPGPFQMAP